MASAAPDPAEQPAWQERCVARSLDRARARTLVHAHRAVAAAETLLNDDTDFTMAQVAASAGMSLKTLYRHFESKDDLLLAVYEEATRRGAGALERMVDEHRAPLDRIAAFVEGLFTLTSRDPHYSARMVTTHWHVSRERPKELAASRAPMVDLLAREIEHAARQGQVRAGAGRREAELVFTLVLGRLHAAAPFAEDPLQGDEVDALVAFCLHGLGATCR